MGKKRVLGTGLSMGESRLASRLERHHVIGRKGEEGGATRGEGCMR